MPKKILFCFFIVLSLFAQDDNQTLTDDFMQYKNNVNTPTIINSQERRNLYSDDIDEVTLEHIKASEKMNITVQSATPVKIYYAKKTSNASYKNNNFNFSNKQKFHNFYITGYCVVPNTVKISRLSAMAYLKCHFNNGYGTLATLIVPDLYSKALIAKPLYITYENNPNKRFFVLGGVLMNAQRTSLNIASIINDRKIDRFLAKTGIDSANIVTQNAIAYLEAKQKSLTQTQVTYIKDSNGNTIPVQSQTTKPPKISDYVNASVVQLLSKIVDNASNIFYEDLPYMFLLKAHTELFADLYVTDNPNIGLPNINKNTNNLVVKNPPYSTKTPSQILLSPPQRITK